MYTHGPKPLQRTKIKNRYERRRTPGPTLKNSPNNCNKIVLRLRHVKVVKALKAEGIKAHFWTTPQMSFLFISAQAWAFARLLWPILKQLLHPVTQRKVEIVDASETGAPAANQGPRVGQRLRPAFSRAGASDDMKWFASFASTTARHTIWIYLVLSNHHEGDGIFLQKIRS